MLIYCLSLPKIPQKSRVPEIFLSSSNKKILPGLMKFFHITANSTCRIIRQKCKFCQILKNDKIVYRDFDKMCFLLFKMHFYVRGWLSIGTFATNSNAYIGVFSENSNSGSVKIFYACSTIKII
jgi:hypothetical protein